MSPALLSLIIFGIFVIIFVWDKLPMATSAMLACAIMVILQIVDFSTAFGQFASTNTVMLLGVMVVGAAMTETGLAASIGNLVTKVSRNSERGVVAAAYTLSYFLSAFLSNASVLAIFLPILFGMNTKDGKINHRNLVMPVLVATTIGGISTLVGSTQQLTANGLIQDIGYELKVFDQTPVGAVLGLAGLLFCSFIGYPIGKRIWGNRPVADGCEIAEIKTVEIDKRRFITMIVILVLMVASYIINVIPAAVTACMAGLLCIITGCITQKKAISMVNWNVLGRLGGVLGLAKVLTAAGGVDLLSEWVQGIIGTSMAPYALFAISVLITQLLSLVLFNSTTIILVLSIICSLSAPMGLNPVPFAIGITMGASMGISCPLSGSTNQMSMAAGYRFKDYFKYGALMDLIGYIVIVVFTPIFFSLTL